MKGKILMDRRGKLLLLVQNKYFVIRGEGKEGDEVEFDEKEALPMPSYLFAIAAIEEENLDETLDFIQSKWFSIKK